MITAFFILGSLISYRFDDPSFLYFSTTKKTIANWFGVFGANISVALFYFCGFAAYLLPAFLLFVVAVIWMKKDQLAFVRRVIGFILLILAASTFLQGLSVFMSRGFWGGWLGFKLYNFFVSWIGDGGVLFTFLGLIAIGFLLVFDFSILQVFALSLKFIFRLVVLVWNFAVCSLKKLFVAVRNKLRGGWFFKRAAVAIDDKSEEDNFWGLLLQSKSENKFSLDKCKKYESKKVFVDFKPVVLLKKDFKWLPNSVFPKNIFSVARDLSFSDLLDQASVHFNKTAESASEVVAVQNRNSCDGLQKFGFDALEMESGCNGDDENLFRLPRVEMFVANMEDGVQRKQIEAESIEKAKKLEEKLRHFGIGGKVVAIKPGPMVTLFEFMPEIDSKISKIVALEDDLALALTAVSIRIIAPIPGRNVVGFEIANKERETVFLSELLLSKEFEEFGGQLPVALGVDIVGDPVVEDLVYMPHLLVAGSTGSGKSVGLNVILMGLLCKFSPKNLRLILIDPKRLEFAPYADVPHLLFPIITTPTKAVPVLKWLVQEMEHRYEKMAEVGVRNVLEYQSYAKKNGLDSMPFIVLMIDELADLMMVAGRDIEMQIARLAQMARAAGIHMIVATQRPSVDVVTGLIKVNFPSRIAFRVSSKIDSRTIIDSVGAEKLLGRGDMLYLNSSSSLVKRVHGAFVSDIEVERLTNYLRKQQTPNYLNLEEELRKVAEVSKANDMVDELYPDVLEFIKTIDEISISMLQRRYRIGFNRSARLIERLELDGLIGPATSGGRTRKILR